DRAADAGTSPGRSVTSRATRPMASGGTSRSATAPSPSGRNGPIATPVRSDRASARAHRSRRAPKRAIPTSTSAVPHRRPGGTAPGGRGGGGRRGGRAGRGREPRAGEGRCRRPPSYRAPQPTARGGGVLRHGEGPLGGGLGHEVGGRGEPARDGGAGRGQRR